MTFTDLQEAQKAEQELQERIEHSPYKESLFEHIGYAMKQVDSAAETLESTPEYAKFKSKVHALSLVLEEVSGVLDGLECLDALKGAPDKQQCPCALCLAAVQR